MFLRKLAVANFLARKARAGLTVAAIALSVSLVVAVTSGYASVRGAVHKFLDQYMGSVDAQVSRKNDPRGAVPERVVEALRNDKDVKRAIGRVEIETALVNDKGEAAEGRLAQVFGVDRTQPDPRVDNLKLEAGRLFGPNEPDAAVIDQALAERMKIGPGASITIPGPRKETVKVVGVVRKPEIIAQQIQTMYVPMRLLQRFQGWDATHPDGPQVNRVTIELAQGTNPRAWEQRWQRDVLPKVDPAGVLKLKLTRDTRDELDKQLGTVDLLSYLGGTVSMLAATFIVFTSLSMGVTERQRTLAMLRAVGAYRSQVGMLVVIEGMMLAALGVLVGVPLGWVWVRILAWWFNEVFTAGVVVSWPGVALGSVGSIAAALAASVLPAWWATRVDPLEAMSPDSSVPSGRTPLWAALAGLVLISIDPFLFFGPIQKLAASLGAADPKSVAFQIKFFGHFGLGLPGVMFGFFLLAPAFVKLIEWSVGPLVARAFGLNPALLRQQLSNGLWRAAGTCAALMVGLAVLIVMQVQGNSSLKGWRLPVNFPDIFVVTPPGGLFQKVGLTLEQQQLLEGTPGIKPGEVMPIAIASPEFGQGVTTPLKIALNPDATMFFGIDPTRAFKMMELDFRDGNKDDAQRMLTAGRRVTLKDGTVLHGTLKPAGTDFDLTGVKRDVRRVKRVDIAPADAGGWRTVTMKDGRAVTGSVTPAGAGAYEVEDVDGNMTGLAKSEVVSLGDAGLKIEHGRYLIVTNEFRELKGMGVGDNFPLKRVDEKVENYTIVGVVWSPGIDVIVSVFDMGRQFDQRTASSVFGSLRDSRTDFGVDRVYLFAANLEMGHQREDLLKDLRKRLRYDGLRAGDVRQIKERITVGFDRLLLLASSVAFAAMAVASLGVTNTVMAGIRTRRWQFGVLRSIGVTRSQLLRLVMSEATLLGLIACALGLTAGALMSVDAHELSRITTGYNPPVAVPWGIVWIGLGIVMFISLAASLWPAVSVARSEPLTLLQAGRAST